ncbi:MAG: sigma-54 dependent transcriptional regulator [Pseudomonadota bacterium]
MNGLTVYLVDDEEDIRLAIGQSLELHGLDVRTFATGPDMLAALDGDGGEVGAVISDIRMPGMDGLSLLRETLARDADLPLVLITGHGDVPLAVEALKAGAEDFIEKPFETARLTDAIDRAIRHRQLILENRLLKAELAARAALDRTLIGRAQVMVDLRARLERLAETETDVLVTGETGTGKELAARALHTLSPRADRPFVTLNISALSEGSIESELFGHEAGAFPGAIKARAGKFEHARGGTLFLDAIDAISPALQAKLLRVIEDRQVTRLGSNSPIELDVRFLAASRSDLLQRVADGAFRPDLYYRLAVATVDLPPLRAHKEDIPALFHHFVRAAAHRYDCPVPDISAPLLADLSQKTWPGNVRELRNVADRIVLGIHAEEGSAQPPGLRLPDRVDAYERQLIETELASNQGHITATYEGLGISRKTLYDKMQKYGLSRADFRPGLAVRDR